MATSPTIPRPNGHMTPITSTLESREAGPDRAGPAKKGTGIPANGKVYVVIKKTKALAAFHYLGDASRCAAAAGGRAAGARTSLVPYTDSLNSDHYCKRNGRVRRHR